MARPPRIPNWLPWEQSSVYFITFCVEKRRHVRANPRAWSICLNTLSRLNQWTTLAAITMPDHLHLLAAPLDREASVSAFSKWFKRWFDEEYCRPSNARGAPRIQTWTLAEGCFDRLLRSDESPRRNGNTCQKSRSRRFATEPEDWPYRRIDRRYLSGVCVRRRFGDGRRHRDALQFRGNARWKFAPTSPARRGILRTTSRRRRSPGSSGSLTR